MVKEAPGRLYWNERIETMDRGQLKELQEERLLRQIRYAYQFSALHRTVWDKVGVNPDNIQNMVEFQKQAPTINKDMVRDFREELGDPFGGMLCMPYEGIFISTSSGTTGVPTVLANSHKDVDHVSEAMARHFWSAGLRPGEYVQLTIPFFHALARPVIVAVDKIGALPIYDELNPMAPGRAVATIQWLRPTLNFMNAGALTSAMTAVAKQRGLESREVFGSLRGVIWGGEVMTSRTRMTIEEEWETNVFEFAGLGDLNNYVMECLAHDGMHNWDDFFFVEVLDEDGSPQPLGTRGEITFTSLVAEATPAIRWRTDDIGYIVTGDCPCGRTHSRIRYLGRKSYEVVVGNQTVFPSEIQEYIEQIPETSHGLFQIIKNRSVNNMLYLRVAIESSETEPILRRIEEVVSKELSLDVQVEAVTREELLRQSPPHKIPRVVDK